MENIILILMTTLFNSSLTNTESKMDLVFKEPHFSVPVEKTIEHESRENVIPMFAAEIRSHYNPAVYGDATKIQFSNGISFDTRYLGKAGEPNLPSELKTQYQEDEFGYYIVQFSGPIYEIQKDLLNNNDVTIHFYVPHYGFVCTIKDQTTTNKIRTNPLVNWVGIYQPAYKISKLFDNMGDEYTATMLLFMDTDISEVLNEVKTITNHSEFIFSDNGINKIIKGVINKNEINEIAKLKGVYWIEPYFQPELHNKEVQWILQDAEEDVRNIWDKGIAGEGEIINIYDSGINTYHYAHCSGHSPITTWGYYPYHNAIVAYDSGSVVAIQFGDGAGASWHGTHTTGTSTGDDTLTPGNSDYDGIAKKSRVYFLDGGTNNDNLIYTFADLNDAYIRCYDRYYPPTRAHISSNSWGSAENGAYNANCFEVDQFMWAHKDFLLFYSNGNSGISGSVGAPASAKNCVSVGGCRNGPSGYVQYYTWTSRGPTQDGRYKPTILSPGQGIVSTTSGTNNYGSLSGTSMASPGAAGAGVLVRQYLREGWYPTGKKTDANGFSFISASLIKAILVNSADPNVAAYTVPDNNIGWGRIDLDSTLFFAGDARKTLLIDNAEGILTGDRIDYYFHVPTGAANLKISLVWTDYPGNPTVLRQLVNDLDLSAYIGATYYRGNQYSDGESTENPTEWDTINVEECIRVNQPANGDWQVSVESRNVAVGPQQFSLVISYNADSVTTGIVSLDKADYTATGFTIDTVRVRVEDTNYGSASAIDSVLVVINGNLLEPDPESLWCTELAESAYVFKSEFPLLFDKSVHGDGYLSVSQGDTITATYTDTDPSFIASTWASVSAPNFTISNVHCENIEATSAEACWTTNKNANSTICYGSDPNNLNLSVSDDSSYFLTHSVRFNNLTTKTTYYYDVESEDIHGNKAFDNNGGQHYSFTTRPGGEGVDVLVVVLNSDGGDDPFVHPDFVIDALNEGGWTFNWWQTKQDGDFSRDMLKQYKAVFFQVANQGPTGGNYPVWTVAQKETIKLFHDEGARFTMVGFDIGWDPWQNSPSADTNFCKDYLHFRYIGDIVATSWTDLYGISGDPISGDYADDTVPYHPSRTGAAGDSIVLSGTGASGTGSYVWHGKVPNDSCAIKWESQNNMGTSGDGVWGGHKTRVVTNAFDISQIDTLTQNSPDRLDILNKLFIWLIGHDHPDVTLNSPVSGSTYTSSPISIEWNGVAHGGASIDSTWVEYSPDEGQTWLDIVSGTDITSPYDWDASNLLNGAGYQVKVTVGDKNVYPSMKGTDQTENFIILIPGNDNVGPIVISQTIVVSTNPMVVTAIDTVLSISAVVSDSSTGFSNIGAAEWSIGSEPFASGSGYVMNAEDGSFDEIQEIVNGEIYFTYMPGVTQICTLWVRAQDAPSNNWGDALMRSFTVIDGQAVGISEIGDLIPFSYSLSSPMPNPWRNGAMIAYGIPKAKRVKLKVYNCLGQVVKTFVDEVLEPGFYKIHWNGKDDMNRKLSSGVYFCRLSTDDYTATKKMVMVK